jgi:hypothetical protein
VLIAGQNRDDDHEAGDMEDDCVARITFFGTRTG